MLKQRLALWFDPKRIRPQTLALVLLIAVGIWARLWLVWNSRGTNDIGYWEIFGKEIAKNGIRHCYELYRVFNHPPLMGYWAFLSVELSRLTTIPFEVIFRLAPLAAEAATGVLLYRIWQRRNGKGLLAAALYPLALNSYLVGAYHGNTDLILAYLCLLAAYLFTERRPLGAGLALAAAINVKIMPILLLPLFLLQCRNWRDSRRLVLGLSVAAIPFIPLFLTIPGVVYRNVFAYQAPVPMRWGLYGLLATAKDLRNMPWRSLYLTYWEYGRFLVIVAALAIAVLGRLRKKYSVYQLSAAAIAAFLVLAPGFGIQYTTWCVPLFFALSLGRALVYANVAGLFLLAFYLQFWTRTPRIETFASGPIAETCIQLGLITWTVLLMWLGWLLRANHQGPPAATNGAQQDPVPG